MAEKKTLDEVAAENNTSVEYLLQTYYEYCIEECSYDMMTNAKNLVLQFNLNESEFDKIYDSLNDKFDHVTRIYERKFHEKTRN